MRVKKKMVISSNDSEYCINSIKTFSSDEEEHSTYFNSRSIPGGNLPDTEIA